MTTPPAAPVAAVQTGKVQSSVYVYELPVRLWHWINAGATLALVVTGYLIASPLPTISGEASDYYLMGWLRLIHFVAGYVFGIGLLARIYWAVAGNRYATEIFYIPIWSRKWTDDLIHQIRWTLFLSSRPMKFEGHNPLAHLAMFTMFVVPSVFLALTGFALYAEAKEKDEWLHIAFSWFIALFPNTQDLRTWHHVGMWVLIWFIIVHVYIAVREDIMSRQSLISTMVGGERMFKDDQP